VPEIASRRHAENISWVVREALSQADLTLDEIDAIAVTYAPGLIGALLVGISFAKGLAMSENKPLVPVHHIAGHIAANYLTHEDLKPPYLCLVISGGHSHIIEVLDYTHYHVVGRTRDDAAGECFDKAARTLGYEYPGGKYIDSAAKLGNPNAYKLPKPKIAGSEYDFSFSGLKTAVINAVHNAEQKGEQICREDMAASFQKTVADTLVERTMAAAENLNSKSLAIAGGVSANSGVREAFEKACAERGIALYMPEMKYCGDNAAMIACQGYYDFVAGKRADESLNGIATLSLDKISI
jgi:N6-L-threonylcarbamoyladenine synthase